MSTSTALPFQRLPRTVLFRVFWFLPLSSASALAQTCRLMSTVFANQRLWAHYVRRDFGVDPGGDVTPREAYREECIFREAVMSHEVFGQPRPVTFANLLLEPFRQPKFIVRRIADFDSPLEFPVSAALAKADPQQILLYLHCFFRRGRSLGANKDLLMSTPIHTTCTSDATIECTRYLLQHGVHPDSRDIFTHTPLFLATERAQLKTMSLLIEYGANPNVIPESGVSPLLQTLASGKDVGFVAERAQILIGGGADPNLKTRFSVEIISLAATHGRKVLQLVRDAGGVSVSHTNEELDRWAAKADVEEFSGVGPRSPLARWYWLIILCLLILALVGGRYAQT